MAKTPREKCWDEFSKFIRVRDANHEGYCKCCTCPHVGPWKSFDAGHFMSSKHESTFLHEQNVNAQCKGCNGPGGGKQYEHGLFIDKKYGKGTSDKLYIQSKQLKKRGSWEYNELAKHYRQRAKEIAKSKGICL